MDAYPMIERCFQLQQGFAWPISDLMESGYVPGMILLDSTEEGGGGRGPVAVMQIKYITDDMMDHAKAQMDRYRQDADGNTIEEGYADV